MGHCQNSEKKNHKQGKKIFTKDTSDVGTSCSKYTTELLKLNNEKKATQFEKGSGLGDVSSRAPA